jgi:hypothetical protein
MYFGDLRVTARDATAHLSIKFLYQDDRCDEVINTFKAVNMMESNKNDIVMTK